jgi:hypothetical protein
MRTLELNRYVQRWATTLTKYPIWNFGSGSLPVGRTVGEVDKSKAAELGLLPLLILARSINQLLWENTQKAVHPAAYVR